MSDLVFQGSFGAQPATLVVSHPYGADSNGWRWLATKVASTLCRQRAARAGDRTDDAPRGLGLEQRLPLQGRLFIVPPPNLLGRHFGSWRLEHAAGTCSPIASLESCPNSWVCSAELGVAESCGLPACLARRPSRTLRRTVSDSSPPRFAWSRLSWRSLVFFGA